MTAQRPISFSRSVSASLRWISFTSIVARAGDEGITLEEALAIDEKTFQSGLREKHKLVLQFVHPDMIIEKGGRYYLAPEYKEANKENIPDWVSILNSMLEGYSGDKY